MDIGGSKTNISLIDKAGERIEQVNFKTREFPELDTKFGQN